MRYQSQPSKQDPQQIGNFIPAKFKKQDEEIIYLRLHYKNTDKLVRSHADEWNKKILDQYPAIQKKVMSTRHSKIKKEISRSIDCGEYSAKDIKATHLDTFFVLLKMYGSFLNNNSRNKLKDAKFMANNAAISTKRGLCSKTIIDHIHRIINAGFIKKTFRGSNTSYAIEFNTDILAADMDILWCELLVKKWQKENNNTEIPQNIKNLIYNITPSFSNALSNGTITFREHTDVYKNIYNTNNNISGTFSNGGNLKSFTPNPLQPKKQGSTKAGFEDKGTKCDSGDKIFRAHNTPSDFYVSLCWRIAFAAFSRWWKPNFNNGNYQKREIETAKYFIAQYIQCDGENVSKDISHIINNFSLIINKNASVIHRMPNGFCPRPSWYFNPESKCTDGSPAGFLKAKEKFEEDVKNKFSDKWKSFNKNIKITTDLIKKYYSEDSGPKATIYHAATQRLSKMKNDYFLKLFLTSISDEKRCNSENI